MCTNASKRILITMIASLIMDIYIYKIYIKGLFGKVLCRIWCYQPKQGCAESKGWAGIWQRSAGPFSPSGQGVTGRFGPGMANSAVPKPPCPAWPGSREWFQLCIYPPALLPGKFCCSGSCCNQPFAGLQELLPFCPTISFPGGFHCKPTARAGVWVRDQHP